MDYVFVKDHDGCLLRCPADTVPIGMEIFHPGAGWEAFTEPNRMRDWFEGMPLTPEQADELQKPVASDQASE